MKRIKTILIILLALCPFARLYSAIPTEEDIKGIATLLNCKSNGRTLIFNNTDFPDYYTAKDVINYLGSDFTNLCVANFINLQITTKNHYGISKTIHIGLSDFLDSSKRVSIKDHPKAKSVNLTLTAPRYWTEKEGKAPHIVKKYELVANSNILTYAISIFDAPTFISRREAQEIFDGINSDKSINIDFEEWFLAEVHDAEIISKANDNVGAYPAKRIEYTIHATKQGIDINIYNIAWLIFYEDKIVFLTGSVMTDDRDEMNMYKNLFCIITNNANFYDIYTE